MESRGQSQAQGHRCNHVLSDLFILRDISGHIRSDNGPELVAEVERESITAVGEITAYVEPDAAKAEEYFERALTVARQQQAKSWELRAAMSMARLWRDQGKMGASARTARSGVRLVHRRV